MKTWSLLVFSVLSVFDSDSADPNILHIYTCPDNRTKPCVPKCCDLNSSFDISAMCINDYETNFLPPFSDITDNNFEALPAVSRYEYFIGNPCTKGRYYLDPDRNSFDAWSLFSNGTLRTPYELFTMLDFCMENLNKTLRVFICFDRYGTAVYDAEFYVYPLMLLISIPLLVITAAVHTYLKNDLNGKTLSCHVLCLAVAYFILSLIQLEGDSLGSEFCIFLAFALQFFYLSCFCWLNIMSYECYRTLGKDEDNKLTEKKRFVSYFMCAWFGPGLLLIISLVMDLSPGVSNSNFVPEFGKNSCWFKTDLAAFFYFYAPAGVLIIVNIIFFVLSAKRIRDIEGTAENSNGCCQNYFSIYAKFPVFMLSVLLAFIMTFIWLTEIISWAAGNFKYIWVISDVLNALHAFVIFYIFVLRTSSIRTEAWQRLKNLCTCKRRNRNNPRKEQSQRGEEYSHLNPSANS